MTKDNFTIANQAADIDGLISILKERHIKLSLRGGKIQIITPPGAYTEEIQFQLRTQKTKVVEKLKAAGQGYDLCATLTDEVSYDIIKMDLTMPEIDGYEALTAILKTQNEIPIMKLSDRSAQYKSNSDEELVDYLIEKPELLRHTGRVKQALRMAKLKRKIISEFGAYTNDEVAKLYGSSAANTSTLTSRLRKEKKIVSVSFSGETLFPAFQFDSNTGQVKPIMKPIIERYSREYEINRVGWPVCIWMACVNGYLDGERPVDMMDSAQNEVLKALEMEFHA